MNGCEKLPSSAGSAGGGRGPHDGSTTPADLKIRLREQTLTIQWQDGSSSQFNLAVLRKHCPCAACRTERDQQGSNPLRVLRADPAGLKVVSAKLVGQYAIQFDWSDGHDTGIFDFRYLRGLEGAG